jgi:hypothetical protein
LAALLTIKNTMTFLLLGIIASIEKITHKDLGMQKSFIQLNAL